LFGCLRRPWCFFPGQAAHAFLLSPIYDTVCVFIINDYRNYILELEPEIGTKIALAFSKEKGALGILI
jgi:hypothetical protein